MFPYLYIHALPFLQLTLFFNWVKSCTSKKIGYEEYPLVKACCLTFTRETVEFINITTEHCLCTTSTTDLGEEQMAVWRAFVSC